MTNKNTDNNQSVDEPKPKKVALTGPIMFLQTLPKWAIAGVGSVLLVTAGIYVWQGQQGGNMPAEVDLGLPEIATPEFQAEQSVEFAEVQMQIDQLRARAQSITDSIQVEEQESVEFNQALADMNYHQAPPGGAAALAGPPGSAQAAFETEPTRPSGIPETVVREFEENTGVSAQEIDALLERKDR